MTLLKVLFLLLSSTALWAQSPLSIEQAMGQASDRHPQIAAAEARAKAARAQARQAIGYRLPSIDISETFIRTNNPAEAFAFQMNQERFNMAEFGNPANDPNSPDILNTYMTRAEATLPLFTGGMLHGRALQAHSMAKAAAQDEVRTREIVAFDAATSWLNLSKAREYKELMRRALATAEAHETRADEYHEQGMLAPSDVLRAQVFVAEMREYLTRAEEQEQLAQAALNFQMGNPQEAVIELAELALVEQAEFSLTEALKSADVFRPDLIAAREKLRAGKLEATVARSSFMPQIGLVGRYDWYDDEIVGDNGSSWSIMGQAKLNIFRGGTDRHAWQKALLEAHAGEAEVKRFKEGVSLEVRQACAEQTSARLRYETAGKALDAGRENLRVTEARYAQGVAQMIDMLDAQAALRELEVRELTARYDLLLAAYRIRFVTGQSLVSK